MTALASYCLLALAGLLAIPGFIFAIEVAAALILPARKLPRRDSGRRPIAILIPAHNESTGILPTIEDVTAQMTAGDRLLVVADNCVDDTAAVAGHAGAEVIMRQHSSKKGKGYALEFGIAHLSDNPPATVIIIDADCRVAPHTIDRLAAVCEMSERPVQALDLMTAPAEFCDQSSRRGIRVAREELGSTARTKRAQPSVPTHGHGHGATVAADRDNESFRRFPCRGHETGPRSGRGRRRTIVLHIGTRD